MPATRNTEIQIGRIYSPLVITPGITVQGNVPDVQQYDIAANTYEPDYTNTNLLLKPAMEITDPDGIIPDGPATLTNIKWTLTENGTTTTITASTPGFAIAADGALTVSRNCSAQNPMTLRFEADYLDTRTGEIHNMLQSHLIQCEAVSERPVLTLDTSGLIAYDPVRDAETTRTVSAALRIGGAEVPAANRKFIWQKADSDNIWAQISASDPMDYDVAVSSDGTQLTIRPWLIGDRIDIRCYALYSPYGNPSTLQIDSRTPVASFTVSRVEGRLRAIVKAARQYNAGVTAITPEAVVMDSKGVIPDPGAVLDIEWRTSTGAANGALNKSAVIARGVKPTIPASFIAPRHGGKLILQYGAKAPLKALTTADGKILTTADGKILLAR